MEKTDRRKYMLIIEDIRQLRIVHRMIQNQSTGKPEEFASALYVSRRKLYYLLEVIKKMGAQVAYSRTNCTFYYRKRFDLDISIKIKTMGCEEWQDISGGSIFSLTAACSMQDICTEAILLK